MLTRIGDRLQGTERHEAILLYIGSGLVFSVLDAYTKAILGTVPVVGTLWARYLVFFALVLIIMGGRRPQRLVRSKSPLLQVARGVALFATTLALFFSLSLVPLGQAVALASVSPLIIVVLAGPLLHERVTKAAVLGTLVGFVGVVSLVSLDSRGFEVNALWPLATSAGLAAFSLLARSVGHEPEAVTLFYTGAVGLGLASAALILLWPGADIDPIEWAAAGFVGVVALVGQWLVAKAYRKGEASDLAPFSYLALVWGFLIGATIFGEPIEATAVAGAIAIAIGGLITLRGNDKSPAFASRPDGGVAIDEDRP